MASTPVLRVEKLTKRYRHVRAIEELNFEIHPGEFVGFIGPNGAGKSTTMRCIAGQLLPDAGKVEIQGVNVAADPVAARRAASWFAFAVNAALPGARAWLPSFRVLGEGAPPGAVDVLAAAAARFRFGGGAAAAPLLVGRPRE
jgi:hypothetical protein